MNYGEIITLNKNERYKCSKDIKAIRCIDGEFWITYKSGKDIILVKGEELLLKNKKKVIIQVLKKGKISLQKKRYEFYLLFNLFQSNKIIKGY